MSFFGIARDAAAAEYGRARAERYGRIARAWVIFRAMLIIGFIIGMAIVMGRA